MDPERWQLIDRLYHEALEHPPDERDSFLREACGNDEGLRREVHSLLAHGAEPDSFMELPAIEAEGRALAEVTSVVADGVPASLVGETIAHYEIAEELGAGGMGVVYRARDMKLGREVAIKTLPLEFAGDVERVIRLEHEARALAALSHPNIASIYGLETSGSRRFLVLELIQGETLAARLRRGPVSLEEALRLGVQIAEALEAAHDAGIVHRDLKPSNIQITPAGRVKILDFGLAGLSAPTVEQHERAGNEDAVTQIARFEGTPQYMSPEEIRGQPSDARADIWAFGCVLFEMLTGQTPFRGTSVSEIVTSVLDSEPDWSLLGPDADSSVRRVLRRCLRKNLIDRLHHVGDVRIELAEIISGSGNDESRRVEVGARKFLAAGMVIAVSVLFIVVLGWGSRSVTDSPARSVTQFDFVVPGREFVVSSPRAAVAVTRDGSAAAFAADDGLYLRRFSNREAHLLPGSENDRFVNPVFSPDGVWIAYWSPVGEELRRVPVRGGSVETILRTPLPLGMSWSADNRIVFATEDGVISIPAFGGAPEVLVNTGPLDDTNRVPFGPQLLPDGDHVLFTVGLRQSPRETVDWDQADVVVAAVGSDVWTVVREGASDARFLESGHISYMSEGSLYVQPFSPRRFQVAGQPVQLVGRVQRANGAAWASSNYAFSAEGTLIYIEAIDSPVPNRRRPAFVDRNGEVTPIEIAPHAYAHPRLSPDGRYLAVQTIEDNGRESIWVYDLSGGQPIRELTPLANNSRPVWSPDSQGLTFASDRRGSWSIYWQDAFGQTDPVQITQAEPGIEHQPESWSADGRLLSFTRLGESIADQTVWLLDAATLEVTEVVSDGAGGSALSPNGDWIAYRRVVEDDFDALTTQVFVQPIPPTGSEFVVSDSGGSYPMWSVEGTQLFYRSGIVASSPSAVMDRLVAVEVRLEGIFEKASERVLPIEGFLSFFGYRDFDVAPGGERFVMIFPADETEEVDLEPLRVHALRNWFDTVQGLPDGI